MEVGASSRAAGSASTRNRSCFSSAIRCLASSSVLDHEINVALTLAFDPVTFGL